MTLRAAAPLRDIPIRRMAIHVPGHRAAVPMRRPGSQTHSSRIRQHPTPLRRRAFTAAELTVSIMRNEVFLICGPANSHSFPPDSIWMQCHQTQKGRCPRHSGHRHTISDGGAWPSLVASSKREDSPSGPEANSGGAHTQKSHKSQ